MGAPIRKPELADQREDLRIRRLPHQLDRARARVRQLEAQARRLRMYDLVSD